MTSSIDQHSTASHLTSRIRAVIGDASPVPLHEPEFAGAEEAFVVDCVRGGWVSSVGAYVDRFESMVAEACGAAHAVATVNGTAALHTALLVAGVQPGEEVLTQSLTFVATANAIHYCGARPHFVDVKETTLGLSPTALAERLEAVGERRSDGVYNRLTGRRLAAVLPMHTFGHPVEIDALLTVAADWGLPLVEDAAESLGSLRGGAPLGARGVIGAVSFNGNKIITTGGGGAVVTNDAALAARAKHLTTTARRAGAAWAFIHDEVGYNYRLPNINAALGCAQLEQLASKVARKRALAAAYAEALADLEGLRFVREPADCASNYWLNAVLLDDATSLEATLTALNDTGLLCRPAWTPMHRLPPFAEAPQAPLPVTEDLAGRLINLPSSAHLMGPPADA